MRKKAIMGILVSTLFLALLFLNFQAEEREWINQNDENLNKIPNSFLNDSPIVWTKTFGGRGSDLCWALDTTTDGGCILVGETSSFGSGGGDVWLIKVDQNGREEWNKTYGGRHSDYGFDGHQTSDNGFILVGGTTSYGAGDHDAWLIKTDQMGNELWNKTFGGSRDIRGML
ncbi:Uncharacterised protein [uncultured archaeon]|nr:Uncharacterised protein [uncultured archaeon]